jgi:hypothetical protein
VMEDKFVGGQSEMFELVAGESFVLSANANRQSGTFTPNMKLPIHRWFRYSAGFSAEWVRSVLSPLGSITVLDPFVGSGTVCVEADKLGLSSFGVESHPFVYRLAKGKTSWDSDVRLFKGAVASVRKLTGAYRKGGEPVPKLLESCFSTAALDELFALRDAFLKVAPDLSNETSSLVFLAINSILRPSSHVGTAQWQYVLPNKRKVKVASPAEALALQVEIMCSDMQSMSGMHSRASILRDDARYLEQVPDSSVDVVITSPPYANNYDYADATRLEMTFWREVESWGGLHDAVRKYLICSSSQHASKEKLELSLVLQSELLGPIRTELTAVCETLAAVKETKGGKKAYDTMLAAYFRDMSLTFRALRRVVKAGGKVCFVVGDSAPYGVYAPVERWMGELALSAGFTSWEFEKIRDRNIKWKNRKHTVPLHEGRLWIDA